MKLYELFFAVFPIVVVVFTFSVSYIQLQLEKPVDVVRNYQGTDHAHNSRDLDFTLGNVNTFYDPYASAAIMLHESKAMFDSESATWYKHKNDKDVSIESRLVESNLIVHRVGVVVQSQLSISEVFQSLTSEAFLPHLYPVSMLISFLFF